MRARCRWLVSFVALWSVFALFVVPLFAQQVSFDRLLRADREPQNWLSYSGTIFNQRHSLLTQVTPANVKNLELQWVWQAKSLEKFEATALAVDGVLYTLQGPPVQGTYQVVALDAVTGRPFWTLEYQPAHRGAPVLRPRQPRTGHPRRHAVHGHDRRAPDRASTPRPASVLWNIEAAKLGEKTTEKYAITHAPLDRQGQGHRRASPAAIWACAATSPRSTRRPARKLWRFYTIPGPGEKGNDTWSGDSWKTGGAGVWNSGAYDADANLVYFGTGNPAPDWDGRSRLGDNLYSDSVVALDADTGKLKWHYQFTPHDEVDYDSTQVPDPRRHGVAGPSAQGDVVGQSQRPRLRAGSRDAVSSCWASRSSA